MNGDTVLLLGLPGAGKSTIGSRLASFDNVGYLSASGALRKYAQAYPGLSAGWQERWSAGLMAPDSEVLPVLWDIYIEMLTQFELVILDGYPRSSAQLDDFLARGGQLDIALDLDVSQPVASARAVARKQGRVDDSETTVAKRMAAEVAALHELTAHEHVSPRLIRVDATLGSIREIVDNARLALRKNGIVLRNVVDVQNRSWEFHKTFRLPQGSFPLDRDLALARSALVAEESKELVDAFAGDDLLALARELADLVLVCYGTAVTFGFDLNQAISAVHTSNMSKMWPDGRPRLSSQGKVLKPPGFQDPDLSKLDE